MGEVPGGGQLLMMLLGLHIDMSYVTAAAATITTRDHLAKPDVGLDGVCTEKQQEMAGANCHN